MSASESTAIHRCHTTVSPNRASRLAVAARSAQAPGCYHDRTPTVSRKGSLMSPEAPMLPAVHYSYVFQSIFNADYDASNVAVRI